MKTLVVNSGDPVDSQNLCKKPGRYDDCNPVILAVARLAELVKFTFSDTLPQSIDEAPLTAFFHLAHFQGLFLLGH